MSRPWGTTVSRQYVVPSTYCCESRWNGFLRLHSAAFLMTVNIKSAFGMQQASLASSHPASQMWPSGNCFQSLHNNVYFVLYVQDITEQLKYKQHAWIISSSKVNSVDCITCHSGMKPHKVRILRHVYYTAPWHATCGWSHILTRSCIIGCQI